MSPAHRLADVMIAGAARLMPSEQRIWVRAMAAEQVGIPDQRAALAFSAGCLRAAGWERLRSLAPDGAWFWPGAAFGTLLLASAMIPHSRMLPLVWAVLGGAVAVLMLGKRGRLLSFSRVVGIAFKTGLLSGLLFTVAAPLLMLALGQAVSLGKLALLALAGLIVTFMTTVGGAAVAPLVCRLPDSGAGSWEEENER